MWYLGTEVYVMQDREIDQVRASPAHGVTLCVLKGSKLCFISVYALIALNDICSPLLLI